MVDFSPSRVTLFIISLTYLLSALILMAVRYRGTVVPGGVIAGWLVTGLVGVALSPLLIESRAWVWVMLAVALIPWMGYSLVGDVKNGSWVMALTDVAGLFGIGWALLRVWRPVFTA